MRPLLLLLLISHTETHTHTETGTFAGLLEERVCASRLCQHEKNSSDSTHFECVVSAKLHTPSVQAGVANIHVFELDFIDAQVCQQSGGIGGGKRFIVKQSNQGEPRWWWA